MERPSARGRQPAAEHRNITVLFCDLVGSTELSEQLDDEAFRDVVRTYQRLATAAIERFGGHVAQHLGDGLMAYLGFPVAHEEDPRRAVLAGLEIAAAIPAANDAIRRDYGVELGVRVGVHTGPTIAGDIGAGEFREQLALGRTPNIAARVQAQAQPGAVLVSDDTWRLVRGFFEARALGPTILKGVSRPMELFEIVAQSQSRTAFDAARERGLSPLVGRADELQRLDQVLVAAAEGRGGIIGIRGEAGIGKSRLSEAFRTRVASSASAEWLSAQCSPYDEASAYAPLAGMLARLFSVEPGDSAAARAAAVRDGVAGMGISAPDAVPLVCELLGTAAPDSHPLPPMTPLMRKERTLSVVADIVAQAAATRPVVMCVEDLHWADASTLEFLALLAARVPALPVLLCGTFRPEFEATWIPAEATIALDRLAPDESRALATSAASRPLPEALAGLIHSRTDGIPLFVEEIAKAIVESGVLDDGRAHDAAAWEAAIPGSLRDSLAARLDRLGPARRIAQVAAVIGRDFAREMLAAVVDDPADEIDAALSRLVDSGLAYREGGGESPRFTFKHALVRDAAYESLLRPARLALHSRVAAAIRDRFPELRGTRPDLVARHMSEAGERAAAIPLWLEAGKRSIDRSANVEAVGFLARGIAALEDVPEGPARLMQELELQMTFASAAMLAGGYGQPRVVQAYARAHALSAQLGSPPQLFIVYFGLWMYYVVTADFPKATAICADLTRMAKEIGPPGYRIEALFCTAYTEYYTGHLHDAQQHFSQAIALEASVTDVAEFTLSPAGDDVRIHLRAFLGMTEWHLGLVDRAVRTAEEGVRLAKEVGYPYGIVWGLDSLGWVHVFRSDPVRAAATAAEMIAICRERGFPFFTALGGLMVGWATAESGDRSGGLAMYEPALGGLLMMGARQSQTLFFSHLATIYIREGRLDDAELQVQKALAAVESTGERAWEPEVLLARADLICARTTPSSPEAAECFAHARRVARDQGALGYTVRACVRAARVLPAGGDRDAALAELRSAIDRVEEGKNAADLALARSLLEH
jgi:class 3 adenylate cyclase/tetratricopeptide (TPR) repeat protein